MKSKQIVIYMREDNSEILIHPKRYNKNGRLVIKSGKNDGMRINPNKLNGDEFIKIIKIFDEECD